MYGGHCLSPFSPSLLIEHDSFLGLIHIICVSHSSTPEFSSHTSDAGIFQICAHAFPCLALCYNHSQTYISRFSPHCSFTLWFLYCDPLSAVPLTTLEWPVACATSCLFLKVCMERADILFEWAPPNPNSSRTPHVVGYCHDLLTEWVQYPIPSFCNLNEIKYFHSKTLATARRLWQGVRIWCFLFSFLNLLSHYSWQTYRIRFLN